MNWEGLIEEHDYLTILSPFYSHSIHYSTPIRLHIPLLILYTQSLHSPSLHILLPFYTHSTPILLPFYTHSTPIPHPIYSHSTPILLRILLLTLCILHILLPCAFYSHILLPFYPHSTVHSTSHSRRSVHSTSLYNGMCREVEWESNGDINRMGVECTGKERAKNA